MLTRRLEGKRALITGAGSGIGQATAHRLAAEGASIAALDVRGEAANQVAIEVAALGAKSIGQAADVGDESSIVAAVSGAVGLLDRRQGASPTSTCLH